MNFLLLQGYSRLREKIVKVKDAKCSNNFEVLNKSVDVWVLFSIWAVEYFCGELLNQYTIRNAIAFCYSDLIREGVIKNLSDLSVCRERLIYNFKREIAAAGDLLYTFDVRRDIEDAEKVLITLFGNHNPNRELCDLTYEHRTMFYDYYLGDDRTPSYFATVDDFNEGLPFISRNNEKGALYV